MIDWLLRSLRAPRPQVTVKAPVLDLQERPAPADAAPESPPTSPPGLLQQALAPQALQAAWERVRGRDGCAGFDRQTVDDFARRADTELTRLRGEVLAGDYRPQPLQRFDIPKPDGGQRRLAVPAVRDRVLQTAVAAALAPRLEARFSDCSYGYRTGRSVQQAVARVVQLRDNGLTHVVDADIEKFFDNVAHARLANLLSSCCPGEPALHQLVALWLAADLRSFDDPGGCLLERGLPQGSPLSPLLANLYLDPLDRALEAGGIAHVRFADDLLLQCGSAQAARAAHSTLRSLLDEAGLKLNEQKTRVTSFAEGFQFLGVRFVHGLVEPASPGASPWLLPRPGPATRWLNSLDAAVDPAADAQAVAGEAPARSAQRAPSLQTLYVTEPGALLTREHDRVVVSVRREVKASVPLGQIDQIAVLDNALVSTALLRRCAEHGIAVAFSGHGETVASVDRGALPEQALVGRQWDAQATPELGLLFARQFLHGKLHNSRTVLRRFSRREGREALEQHLRVIADCAARLDRSRSLNTLRGLEGVAARHHFDAMRSLLPEGVEFPARQRQPPRDPVNAMLSLGYQVLAHNVHTLVRLAGLNPRLGHLHGGGTQPQGLPLVSDLMEEFRAVAVDAVVLGLWRQGAVHLADFVIDPSAALPCRMQTAARQRYVHALETRLDSPFTHPRLGSATDLRRAMQAQVQHYRQVLLRAEPRYLPLKFR